MKKIGIFFILCLPLGVTGQQLLNQFGAYIRVGDGATLKTQKAHLINHGSINNQGRIDVNGSLSNTWETLNQDTILVAGDFSGGFNFFHFSGSSIWFYGDTMSTIHGELNARRLYLDKNNHRVRQDGFVWVAEGLHFVEPQNHLEIGNFSLTIDPAATVSGASTASFVITNGTGLVYLAPAFAGTFTFPVGYETGRYTPVTLTQNGVPDGLGVRALQHALTEGLSGMPIGSGAIDASWEIAEFFPGGSDLDVTLYWQAIDELPAFNRADCGVARHQSAADWDLPVSQMGASVGASLYGRSRNHLSPGFVGVMGETFVNQVKLTPRIALEGAYNAASNQMSDALRGLPSFPLTAPATYGTGKFTHYGRQPAGGYVLQPSVLTVAGPNAIVDWVFVWLKDPLNPSTNIQTALALLQKDGDVVALDGVSPLQIPVDSGQYLLGVGHRNHLSARMPAGSPLTLTEHTVTAYDFTASAAQAFGTNTLRQVDASPVTFALRGGNANTNGSIRATGPTTINDYSAILTALGAASNILTGVYHNADVNLDGVLRATGPTSINDYSRLIQYLGASSAIHNEQF